MRVLRFENEAEDLLHYLKESGLHPGLEGTLADPGDDEVTVDAGGQTHRDHAQRRRDGLGRGRPVAAAAHRAARAARARQRALRPLARGVRSGRRAAASGRARRPTFAARVGERPVAPPVDVGALQRRARRAAARRGSGSRRGDRRAGRRGRAGARGDGGAALLRVRRRRRARRGDCGRHAATGWDQMAFNAVSSPAAAAAEAVVGGVDQGPARPAGGRVVRDHDRARRARTPSRSRPGGTACWRTPAGTSRRDGLAGAPPVRVVAGEERHATIDRSLRLLGMGTRRVEPVARRRQRRDGRGRPRRRARARRRPADDRVRCRRAT